MRPTPTRGGSSAYNIFLVTTNTRAFSGAAATEASTRLGPFGLDSHPGGSAEALYGALATPMAQ